MDALDAIFQPSSIAVIGASHHPGKWGFIIPSNIVGGGYRGKLYLINPKGGKILGLEVIHRLEEVEEDIDLAVVITPARTVPEVIKDCCKKGVLAAIIVSAGFSEAGNEALEKKVVEIARKGNVRLVGPNTMGVYSSTVSLCALMPPVRPIKGSVAFISQSGNLGTQMLAWGQKIGIGFSKFVSSGNEADLHAEDYIQYFARDSLTKVIIAYIEGLDNGRRFLEITSNVTQSKPVIVFKAGTTEAGKKAVVSHCGALAGTEEVYDTAFNQAGIIRASTTEELLDLAEVFVSLPLPRGKNVGILTWGGGWGVVTADACERAGLRIVPLELELLKELDKFLPPYWSRGNPVDLVGTLDWSAPLRCLDLLASSESIDCIIASGVIGGIDLFTSLVTEFKMSDLEKEYLKKMFRERESKLEQKITELIERYKKPIICVGWSQEKRKVSVYPTPERAARAMSKMVFYANHLYHSLI